MISSKKLSISIHDTQFAKDYQYFINVQFEDQKKTTDISAIARNPIFTKNTFFFDLPTLNMIKSKVTFVAYIMSEQEEPTHSKKQSKSQSKILGQCTLDLTPFGLQPTQNYNLPIRQQIKFLRVKLGKQMAVGKCIVSFKLVEEEEAPIYLQQIQEKKIQRRQVFVDLPDYDQNMNFKWRVKVEVRQALNILATNGVVPQVSVQIGWTEYKDNLPQQNRIFSTSIINSNHPQWDQTILITNPTYNQSLKGFIMIQMKENTNLQDIVRLYIPLQSMGVFVPYNIKVVQNNEENAPTQLFLSFILETPTSPRQKLYDIIVSDIIFQPLIAPFKDMNLALVTQTDNQPIIEFYPFNPKSDSIQRVLQFDQARQFTYLLSQSMKVPPIKSSRQFRAATIMTIPQSYLKRQLTFYIVGHENRKYKLAGSTDPIQKDLISMIIQKIKKRIFMSVRPFPDIRMGKCQIQLTEKEQSKIQKQSSQHGSRAQSRAGQETASQKLMKDLNISSNQSFFKHLSQNNEIISRILRQLDDKSESIKQAAAQIADLRSKVKLLQNQNSILRRKALTEEDQLINMVQREIQTMSTRDLKDKIMKFAQLYKNQRIKTKQLDRAIKVMQPQVSNSMQLNSMISSQKNTIQVLEDKIEKAQKDIQRINVYKDTIKKQEKVITKLQKVMKDGMEQVKKAKNTRLQLQQLKKRGGSYQTVSIQARDQIQRLQRIIANLQSNKANYEISNISNGQGDRFELQFKLHQAETRIQYLEEQITEKGKSYARQLAMMKMKLAEKQAVLDGFSHH